MPRDLSTERCRVGLDLLELRAEALELLIALPRHRRGVAARYKKVGGEDKRADERSDAGAFEDREEAARRRRMPLLEVRLCFC